MKEITNLEKMLDNEASEMERKTFVEELRFSAEKRRAWINQVRVHSIIKENIWILNQARLEAKKRIMKWKAAACLVFAFLTGCTVAYVAMRLPEYRAGNPSSGFVYNTPKLHEIKCFRAQSKVIVDGDLNEWNSPVFTASCNEPYDKDYKVAIYMMWDDEKLYIGGNVRSLDAMKNSQLSWSHVFAGGSIVCRLARDSSLGYPLLVDHWTFSDDANFNKVKDLKDFDLFSLVMFYSKTENLSKLTAQRKVVGNKPLEFCDSCWQGKHIAHPDYNGYTFEYAFSWKGMGFTPPKEGERRANHWNIHFSDAEGLYCVGQIIENVIDPLPKGVDPKKPWLFYRSPSWGSVVFEK